MNISQTVKNLPAVKARAEIPPVKRRAQLVKTLAGSSLVAGGLLLPKLGYPWQAGLGVSAFGAFICSQQLVLGYAKALAQFVGALTGKVPVDEPVDGRGAKVDE